MKNLSSVLLRPHITEKATLSSENFVYVFKVLQNATKNIVAKAFLEKYKVEPLKVSVINIPAKKVVVRGKMGKKAGYKKAYIYVKKGTKVEIM
jgi:large subunit ribosomal protein L23